MKSAGKEVKDLVKTSAAIKPTASLREEVRVQHGTDILTFETDAQGNVPVAKIDAVLSHVVALKYRLPQNDPLSPTHRPHSREGRPLSREGRPHSREGRPHSGEG